MGITFILQKSSVKLDTESDPHLFTYFILLHFCPNFLSCGGLHHSPHLHFIQLMGPQS